MIRCHKIREDAADRLENLDTGGRQQSNVLMNHNPVEIIRKKRDGEKLSAGELGEFIAGVVRGDVADYQASAFLMAVFFRGMDAEETAELTRQMLASGGRLNITCPSLFKNSAAPA